MRKSSKNFASLLQRKNEVANMNARAKSLDEELTLALMSLPNILNQEVPDGNDENENVEIFSWGEPKQ